MDMRGENAEYVGITKDDVAFLERAVNDSGCRQGLRILELDPVLGRAGPESYARTLQSVEFEERLSKLEKAISK
jgi:hypothetical protein